MNVKLEIQFNSIDELKAYLDGQQGTAPAPVQTPTTLHSALADAAEVVPFPVPQQPATPAPAPDPVTGQTAAPAAAVPTTAAAYTLDDLSRAGAELVDTGKKDALIAALQRYGVASMPDIPKEQYGAFAAELRALGARI